MPSQDRDKPTTNNIRPHEASSTTSRNQPTQGQSIGGPISWLINSVRWLATNDITSTILAAVVLTLVVRLFIAEARWIPSESMLPTLEIGDRLVVEKVSYHFGEPKRGDIVVFVPPDHVNTNDAFIKRVVGLPGDTVEILLDDGIYINGQKLDESYTFSLPTRGFSYPADVTQLGELTQYPLNGNPSGAPIVVPEGHYFVLGDNRNNSQDSHVWGFLPRENIIGRTFLRFWPLDRLHHFSEVDYPELDATHVPERSLYISSRLPAALGNAIATPLGTESRSQNHHHRNILHTLSAVQSYNNANV